MCGLSGRHYLRGCRTGAHARAGGIWGALGTPKRRYPAMPIPPLGLLEFEMRHLGNGWRHNGQQAHGQGEAPTASAAPRGGSAGRGGGWRVPYGAGPAGRAVTWAVQLPGASELSGAAQVMTCLPTSPAPTPTLRRTPS